MIKNLIVRYAQIIRYIIGGGTATASNLIILFICVHYFNLWYLTSAIISFCSAVIISYLLQKFFVFKNYSRENIHKQFIIFFIFNVIMLGVNTLLIYTFVDIIGLWYLLAQALSSAIGACVNYIYFNKVIFKNA
jgi:putative flippase GtrA